MLRPGTTWVAARGQGQTNEALDAFRQAVAAIRKMLWLVQPGVLLEGQGISTKRWNPTARPSLPIRDSLRHGTTWGCCSRDRGKSTKRCTPTTGRRRRSEISSGWNNLRGCSRTGADQRSARRLPPGCHRDPKYAAAWNKLGCNTRNWANQRSARRLPRTVAANPKDLRPGTTWVLLQKQGQTNEALDAYRQAVTAIRN